MKLWRATVEIELMIAADDKPPDMRILNYARDAASDGVVMDVEEIVVESQIPPDWMKCVPYGETRLNCEDWLPRMKEAAWLAPMPNQKPLPLEE